jgi:hypothetical protein
MSLIPQTLGDFNLHETYKYANVNFWKEEKTNVKYYFTKCYQTCLSARSSGNYIMEISKFDIQEYPS